MKAYIANDHRGTKYALALAEHLRALGLEVEHLGTAAEDSVDYPDYALMLGGRIAAETNGAGADEAGVFGIAICGSGAGICMALNKVKDIRAAVVFNDHIARFVKMHNNANVVCFSADTQELEDIKRWIGLYMDARFEGGRHARRVEKIREMEE